MNASMADWKDYLDSLRWLAAKRWRSMAIHTVYGRHIEQAMANGHADHRGCNYFITDAGRALLMPSESGEPK